MSEIKGTIWSYRRISFLYIEYKLDNDPYFIQVHVFQCISNSYISEKGPSFW